MTERPILFSGPMVRAILDGRKTQTRRILTPQPSGGVRRVQVVVGKPSPTLLEDGHGRAVRHRYGMPGDRLWVRETWAAHWMYDDVPASRARAILPDDNQWFAADPDGTPGTHGCPPDGRRGRWRPSIHMPRWASRITLEVTEVRVQRLHEITEDDARAEGVDPDTSPCDHARLSCDDVGCLGPGHRSSFAALWDSINGERATWASNPWVWAVSFRRLP